MRSTTSTTSTMTLSIALVLTTAGVADAQPPVRPGEASRSDPARSVTLSLTEYNRLIDLAGRPAPPAPAAPVAAALASADLRVRVDRETAHGTFSLAGDVLRAGVSRVKLISGATLLEAGVDGRPLPLAADGTTHSALLSGPGPFNVTLEWGTPLTFSPGRASFVLPVPLSGTARATIDVPGEQADIHVPTGIITRRDVTGGRTVVDVTLRPGVPVEVWWAMRDAAPVAAAREARMLADVYTLVTIGDADIRMASLVDVSIVQGEPRTIDLRLPDGYEVLGISGPAIEFSEPRNGAVVLAISDPAARRVQFLVSLERPHAGGSFKSDTDFVSLPGMQRERGEIAIEGVGTLELEAAEQAGMHRIDVKEINPALQSLARLPLLSAFRYQRTTAGRVAVAMNVQRFPDAGVLAAVADRATATTLVTAEGRALTEVVLQIRNRAQKFLKVGLPPGATIASVDVAGEAAKALHDADGTRLPLLRPGLKPNGAYQVSYVYLHAGTPFAKKGELQMALPKMDIPVGIVEWELFVPERYEVKAVDGNVIPKVAPLVWTQTGSVSGGAGYGRGSGVVGGVAEEVKVGSINISLDSEGFTGQIRGRVTDAAHMVLPGVAVVVDSGSSRKSAVTGSDGSFTLSGVPNGAVTLSASLAGFVSERQAFDFDRRPRRVDFVLSLAAMEERVTVTAESPRAAAPPPPPYQVAQTLRSDQPSVNVLNLQKRAAGVLPIRVDVPRAGTSHQFVKPLVIDQEASISLRYKRR